jgi:antitoxin YefM
LRAVYSAADARCCAKGFRADTFQHAAEDDHFTVTRNGHPHVILVSVAEWDELQETLAILSDSQTRADLAESAEAAERGDFTTEEELQAILDARLGGRNGQ